MLYARALAEAQERGYAEADPGLDVEGLDSAHKLAVLARLAFADRLFGARAHGGEHAPVLGDPFAVDDVTVPGNDPGPLVGSGEDPVDCRQHPVQAPAGPPVDERRRSHLDGRCHNRRTWFDVEYR